MTDETLEDRLRVAEAKLAESVLRRDEFLAMLSHELRNPLAAVVTAAQLLKSETLGAEPARLIEVIDRQTHQMARLLDDLLEASRVTQNKVTIRTLPIDLSLVVDDAATAMRATMAASQLHFTVAITRPLAVEGDAVRLLQVCTNLLNNAIKYTPRGGRVSLEATREGAEAVIRVSDDGAGIPGDMLTAVFDLFVQSSRTIDRAQGGIGVGLTLARSWVDMHGGSVQAASEGEGRGSAFTVRIPLTTKPIAHVANPGNAVVPGVRIALIEDNEDTREMMATLLTRSGFDVRTAADGLAGVTLIDELSPHVALIDIGLPGIDGLEVARRVRTISKNRQVILIALTGYGQRADRTAAIDAGFDAHLVKPIRLDQLIATMAKHERQPLAVATLDGRDHALLGE